MEVETVSGDIDLRDVIAKQVRTHSTSGDVTFAGTILDAGATSSTRTPARSASAAGRHRRPAQPLDVQRRIDSDFPITLIAGEHGIGAAQAKQLNFSLGKGTARIIAETFSGDITLPPPRRPK